MIPVASVEDLRSLPPAVRRKVRAFFVLSFALFTSTLPFFVALPPLVISFPLAGEAWSGPSIVDVIVSN